VVVTYDPGGGYGHPDHVQAHRVTTGALTAAAARWRVPKFYWTVTSASAFRAAIGALAAADVDDDWIWPPDGAPAGFPDEQITTVIDARAHLGAKTAAMRAHATQITVGPTGRAFTLSNRVILPVLGREHYVLAAGVPTAGDHGGPETDLLAGLDLTAR
jgi:N-acetyl-1-D-myo-inositol-2-amino-2-deoxy-alpha-D-glucopyranoside deacetylase